MKKNNLQKLLKLNIFLIIYQLPAVLVYTISLGQHLSLGESSWGGGFYEAVYGMPT